MRPDLRIYKIERRVLEENEGDYRRGKKKEGERVKLSAVRQSNQLVDYGAETSTKRLSNQFWAVFSLVAIKKRTECLGKIVKEVCRLRDGESESPREQPRD